MRHRGAADRRRRVPRSHRGAAAPRSVLGCPARLHTRDRVRAARAAGRRERHPGELRGTPVGRSAERAGAHRRELRALVLLPVRASDPTVEHAAHGQPRQRVRKSVSRLEPRPRRIGGARRARSRSRDPAGAAESQRPVHRRRRVYVRPAGSQSRADRSDTRADRRSRHPAGARNARQRVARARRSSALGLAHRTPHRSGGHRARIGPDARCGRVARPSAGARPGLRDPRAGRRRRDAVDFNGQSRLRRHDSRAA